MSCWPLLLPPPTLHHPQFAIAPPIAIVLLVHRRRARPSLALGRPSPLRSRNAVPRHRGDRRRGPIALSLHRRGAVVPSITVKEPSRRTLPSTSRRPFQLMTPACHAPPRPLVWMVVALPLPTPPPSIFWRLSLRHCLPCLLSVRLVVAFPRFSRRHLPSAGASASHRAIASCHAPLRPLIQLVKVLPLLTMPQHICGIIESSQRSSLMLS